MISFSFQHYEWVFFFPLLEREIGKLQGRVFSGTAAMKDMRSLRPKNLEMKRVALPWAWGLSIQSKQGLSMQDWLHPLLRARQPLQLIFSLSLTNLPLILLLSLESLESWKLRRRRRWQKERAWDKFEVLEGLLIGPKWGVWVELMT